MAALAIFAQKEFGLPDPPIPYDYRPQSTGSSTAPSGEYLTDVVYVGAADVVPQGASAVPAGKPYFVNTTLWEIYMPSGGHKAIEVDNSQGDDHTASGNLWDAGRFCGQWLGRVLQILSRPTPDEKTQHYIDRLDL